MSRVLLWLLASLAFASSTSQADGAPLKVMSAPNLLRVGTAENIFVECQDCFGSDIMVEISVMSHPTKTTQLANTSVNLTSANNFQALAQIMIHADDFSKDPTVTQYVYLQAQFPDQVLEKVVLVHFQSGYIFIQTDKTLYTPNSIVNFRMFAVTPRMEPVEPNDQIHDSITIEIVTPDHIVLPLDTVSPKSGIHTGGYKLGEVVSPGQWKVVAKFYSNPQISFSADFEVKEYMLPSFEVKLTALRAFFYVDSQEFMVNIRATYLFGEKVNGMAYVLFGVIYEDQKKTFPGSLQRVPVTLGNSEATLKREHITKTFPNINELVGQSIFVDVSVLTENGGEMVEATLRDIQIVTSPYSIHFKRTPRYYKPGMSLDVTVEVLNPDGTPAKSVPVVVEPGSAHGLTGDNGRARLSVNTGAAASSLMVTARTNVHRINQQASVTLQALPYVSKGNNYVHISVDTADLKLGDNLKINLYLNSQLDNDITYLILSRGQLVKNGRYKTQDQTLISLNLLITKEMVPSFRIVVYYHTHDNEIVSDSVWVDVKDTCMGTLNLESTRPKQSYEPREMFGLKVTGDPEATVGLVAVDKGVHILNNKHQLTQKKVWDIIKKFDTGCTPGGGKDAMNVFYDAGLLFQTSAGSGTPYRQELRCPAPSRRKRRNTVMDVGTTLASQYDDKLQRDSCVDGMRDTSLSFTCERRSEYIMDGSACVQAFLQCCKQMESKQAERKDDLLLAQYEEDEDAFVDSDEIVSRTRFPESWRWFDFKLPPCPQQTPDCETTASVKNIPLTDSITTWKFTGISLSRTHGICVGDPLEVVVRKEFFIDLRLPYSAVLGEEVEVKAILHNYSPDPAIEVRIAAQSMRSVPFIVIPMKEGSHWIEVKAAVKDSSLSDAVMRELQVVPAGVLVKSPKIVTLDPSHEGVDGKQVVILNSQIPEKDLVPNVPTITEISVTGKKPMVSFVENVMSGNSMGALIYQPRGSGEENMIHMTLPVIATTYLDKTTQWETVGLEKRSEAIQYIKTGYQNELAFRKNDGSFASLPNRPSSTRLTAYVAKVFAMAANLVPVPSNNICDAVKFLILKAQESGGMFREVGSVIHTGMVGDLHGTDSDASMTAFCLITMQESRTICAATVSILPQSIEKAVAYLENRLPHLTNPYAVAMTSYALVNENKLNREILNRFASPDRSHWPVSKGRFCTLEATAYALLALVKAKAFEEARPVVRWFNQQQRVGGSYGSPQATIMVYQAVAEYWAKAKEPLEYDLNLNILLPYRSRTAKFNFNRENYYTTRMSRINDINQNVTVTATGTGEATVTMVSLYYTPTKQKESDCQKFNMSVQLIPVKMDEEERVYKLKIEVLYKDKEHDATLSILDIGLLSGFTVNTADLDLFSKRHGHSIAKYELNTVLSERGSLIIYLHKVSHTLPEEITFRIHQRLKLGVLQPAAVSVYEYYEQTHCVKYYHPERISGQRHQCACAERKKGQIDNDERTVKLCERTDSRIDFACKMRVEEFTAHLSTDIYTVRVLGVIKEGVLDVGTLDKLRTLVSYPFCRQFLNLQRGKTYLIMGTSEDILRDDQKQSYQYVLGRKTWIEYWPTEEECDTDVFRWTCLGLMEMHQMYTVFGCQQ